MTKALIYVSYDEETNEIFLNLIEDGSVKRLKLEPTSAMRMAADLIVMIQPFVTNPLEILEDGVSVQPTPYKSPIGLNGLDQEETN